MINPRLAYDIHETARLCPPLISDCIYDACKRGIIKCIDPTASTILILGSEIILFKESPEFKELCELYDRHILKESREAECIKHATEIVKSMPPCVRVEHRLSAIKFIADKIYNSDLMDNGKTIFDVKIKGHI